jgi:hypothetical protein
MITHRKRPHKRWSGILLIVMMGSLMFTGCSAKQEIAPARYDLGSSTELIIAQIVKIRARRDGE